MTTAQKKPGKKADPTPQVTHYVGDDCPGEHAETVSTSPGRVEGIEKHRHERPDPALTKEREEHLLRVIDVWIEREKRQHDRADAALARAERAETDHARLMSDFVNETRRTDALRAQVEQLKVREGALVNLAQKLSAGTLSRWTRATIVECLQELARGFVADTAKEQG